MADSFSGGGVGVSYIVFLAGGGLGLALCFLLFWAEE